MVSLTLWYGCGVLLCVVVQLRVFAAAKALRAGAAHGESRRTWCKLAIVWPCIVSAVRSDDDMTSPALSVKLYLCTHHGATVRHGGNHIHATDNKTASRRFMPPTRNLRRSHSECCTSQCDVSSA